MEEGNQMRKRVLGLISFCIGFGMLTVIVVPAFGWAFMTAITFLCMGWILTRSC